MLFVVLTELTEVKFNGVIRQLTKLYINKIEKVLRTIIVLEEDQDVGYIVSIFETMIVDAPLKRDIFDLSAMRNILISEEQASKMNLTESLSGTTILDLANQ